MAYELKGLDVAREQLKALGRHGDLQRGGRGLQEQMALGLASASRASGEVGALATGQRMTFSMNIH